MREDLHTYLVEKIRQYPSIYPTGGEVLHHVFCVNGNGIDWVNGEAKDAHEDCAKDSDKVYKSFETYYEYWNKHRDTEHNLEEFYRKFYRGQYEEECKIREEAPWRANIMTIKSFYPLCEYALICNLPRKSHYKLDLTPMWEEALYFMYNMLNGKLECYKGLK